MALFTGCVAAWELDDLTDATGRGNTLTNNNSATFNTGKIGNAVYVASASSQYLSKASSADVEMGDIDFTIGCWAYATSLGATAKHIILGKDASGQREYYLHAEDQGGGSSNYRYSFAVFSGGVEKTVIANTFGNIVAGVWNCIIVWWNASTQTLSISINDGGVDNFSVGADLGAVGTAQFRIGSRQFSGFENYWNGRIDAVHLWKRVLSPTERSEFYNSGNGIEFGGTLAPTARAGLDQVRMELETVMLDSSQSTSGVGIASRLWEQVSGTSVEILNATSVNPTFVAPDVAVDTNLVFKVTITDTESNTAEDQVTITIVPTGSTTWLWNVPQEQGLDPDEFYSSLLFLPTPSMVIRNGRVIGTRGDVTATGFIWSASKSYVAMVFARQLQLANVGYTDTVPGSDNPGTPLATYEQMMAMVSDYGLSPHSPGDHYAYNNAGVHHYGTHLKTTFYPGKNHVEMLQEAFFTALNHEDAITYNAAGLMSGWDGGWTNSTRDFARACQLILQNGVWNGTQILDSDFVDRLYTCQVPDAATQSTDEGDIQTNELVLTVHLHGAYSFGFWLAQNHDFIGAPTMNEAISMIGAFGTTAHISRAKQLIVVACNVGGTTTNDSTVAIPGSVFDLFANAIPEQRSSSRLFRASLHAFFDDEELNRTEFIEPPASNVTVGLSGISATASTGTLGFTKSGTLALAGAQATGAAGTVTIAEEIVSVSLHRSLNFVFFDDEELNRTEFWPTGPDTTIELSSVSGTGSAGTLGVARSVSLSGDGLTALLQSLTPDTSTPLSATATTTTVGSVTQAQSIDLSGISLSATTGAPAPFLTVSTSGNATTASAGSVTATQSLGAALSGVEATAVVGSLETSQTGSQELTGTQASGQTQSPIPVISTNLSGIEIVSALSSLGFAKSGSIGISGVSGTTDSGSVLAAATTQISGASSTLEVNATANQTAINLAGVSVTVTVDSVGATSPGEAGISGVLATGLVESLSFTKSGQVELAGADTVAVVGEVGFSESGEVQVAGNQAVSESGNVGANITISLSGLSVVATVGFVSSGLAVTAASVSAAGEVESPSSSVSISITGHESTSETGNVSTFSSNVTLAISGVLSTASAGSLLWFDNTPTYSATITVAAKPSAAIKTLNKPTAGIIVAGKPSAVLTRWAE